MKFSLRIVALSVAGQPLVSDRAVLRGVGYLLQIPRS